MITIIIEIRLFEVHEVVAKYTEAKIAIFLFKTKRDFVISHERT